MCIGKPISTASLTMQDMEELSAKVQKAVEEMYYEDRESSEPAQV